MDVLWALLLIGAALFLGGLALRHVPPPYLAFGAVLVVFGFGIPALVTNDHKASSSGGGGGGATAAAPSSGTSTSSGGGTSGGTSSGGTKQKSAAGGASAEIAQGKTLFQQNCGTCHTLADAGTNGKVGPVLDQIKPDEKRVLNAIKNGGLGSGTMPTNIVTGKDAQAVAKYVSTVAGK